MIEYSSVRNPQWTSNANITIDCLVFFNHLGCEVPFTASETDCTEHGRTIYSECIEGKYGTIAEYTPPLIRPNILGSIK